MTWMITGASGLLGANLALDAIARGQSVVACYGTHPVSLPAAECIPLPLEDPAAVKRIITGRRAAVIVHCAADTRVDYCEDHPDEAHRVNVEGTRAVAEAAAGIDATLVYISTDSVFAGDGGGYTEDDAPAPRNVYAASKLAGEEAVRRATPNHLILRTNIFGWSPGPKLTLAEWILDRLENDRTVPGFVDVLFSPLLVNDLGDLMARALDADIRGTFHLGAADGISKYAFAGLVADAFVLDRARIVMASSVDAGFRAERPLNTTIKSDRIGRLLGCRLPTVAEGLTRFRHLRDTGHQAAVRACVDEAAWGTNVSAR